MRFACTLGFAGLLLITGSGIARADSCNPVYGTDVDCKIGGKQAGAASNTATPPAPTVKPVGPELKSQLRQKLSQNGSTNVDRQAIATRINDALSRMNAVVQSADGARDPQAQAKLREQYEAAHADFRRGIGEAEAASSNAAQQAKTEAYYTATMKSFNDQLVAAGLYSPASVATDASQKPGELAARLRKSMTEQNAQPSGEKSVRQACKGDDGRSIANCYYLLTGGQCIKQTLGDVGWNPTELATDDCPSELKQAYCQANPQANKGICPQGKPSAKAAKPQPIPDQAADQAALASKPMIISEEEIRAMMGNAQTPEEALLAQLPAECVAPFRQYLDHVEQSSNGAEGPRHAAEAIDGYQRLDASKDCREAIKRIADAHALELPARHLSARTRNAFATAMVQDPSASIPRQSPEVPLTDDGYSAAEVLDFGIALLNLASGAANLAGAMHHGAGGVRSIGGAVGAVRSVSGPPKSVTNYPAPRAPARPMNCTMDANNWLTCK